MKTYYIAIEGYCETLLRVYKVEANSKAEAYEKAKELYFKDLTLYETTEKDYHEFQKEIGEEEEEELTEEDYKAKFGSEIAIRICKANNLPLSDIEEYGSEVYWINDGINNLQDLYDINENYVIPTGNKQLIDDYRNEILEEEE